MGLNLSILEYFYWVAFLSSLYICGGSCRKHELIFIFFGTSHHKKEKSHTRHFILFYFTCRADREKWCKL